MTAGRADFVMEAHQWLNSILAGVALGWSILRYLYDRRSCIRVNCTVSTDSTLSGKEDVADSLGTNKKVIFSITNIGHTPVSVVDIKASFKQIHSSKDESIINLLPNPIFLQSGETRHVVSYSLRDLWLTSLNMVPCVKKVSVPQTNYYKRICDIKTIYVVDSIGRTCKVNPKEVKQINSELLEVAFRS